MDQISRMLYTHARKIKGCDVNKMETYAASFPTLETEKESCTVCTFEV
jgi:hypothetical protein